MTTKNDDPDTGIRIEGLGKNRTSSGSAMCSRSLLPHAFGFLARERPTIMIRRFSLLALGALGSTMVFGLAFGMMFCRAPDVASQQEGIGGPTSQAIQAQDRKAEQDRAIAEIKKLGGKVEVDLNRPDRAVVSVDLKHTKVIDASLEHLKGLTTLETLYLKDTRVTDDGIVYLKGLTNIEALELGRTKVTDKGLEHLKGFTRLQRLDLAGTEVTDKGLEHLMALSRLQKLDLAGTEVTNKGLEHLKKLSQLQALDLSGTKVTNAGIDDLQKALPKVKIVR